MTWALIDDRWAEHPKYLEFSLAEMGLMAASIVYCNRHLTDGVVRRAWLAQRFGREGLKVADKLVARGAWRRLRTGDYEVIGYLDHNPSKEEVLARRRERSAAGRTGGKRSGEARASNMTKQQLQPPASSFPPQQLQAVCEPSPILSDPTQSDPPACSGSRLPRLPAREGPEPERQSSEQIHEFAGDGRRETAVRKALGRLRRIGE